LLQIIRRECVALSFERGIVVISFNIFGGLGIEIHFVILRYDYFGSHAVIDKYKFLAGILVERFL
jgi:hypothetical protein